MKRRFLRWLWRGLLLTLALTLGVQLWFFAHIAWWRSANPEETRFMRLALAELREKNPRARLTHVWVPYERISIHLKRAVIAAEDSHFLEHDGFDWTGIQRALEKNLARGRARAGGSTITQQLAKNLFLSPARSYLRKGEEALIAMMIERLWSKRRILEVYLNVIEWGEGVFGAEAAARHYFGLSADRLGPAEGARLAVILPSPRRYGRHFGPAQKARAARILVYMRGAQVP
ncbi:MAG: monofunctional biosynthetic peptidoglycan transglycosylase [Azoarcus sp.]|jgi:monofunctional biosynthetic peptidoglycan transglycosylase|nr:monofunctional biosynthetic peptidoglycan transglycosylase [Azoarcus sp.]